MKTEIIIYKSIKRIICMQFSKGREHDFEIFKKLRTKINPRIEVRADKGYQGIHKLHNNSRLPKKGKGLSREKERENQCLASERMAIEHVIGRSKRFKTISCRYRNRRKRFGLRFNLADRPEGVLF
ncbi:MAG: transposase family protein [Deinococcaceae bacterium]